jgi:hypothetical protein
MSDRWKNRRRMAWISLLSGLVYPFFVFWMESDFLVGIAPHFYIFIGAVVGAYIGFATVDDRWQRDITG